MDYIDKSKLTGESDEAIDANLPGRFALYGPAKRALILQEIDASAPEEIECDEPSMRKAADRAQLVRELNETHARLRRVGR
jgi:hypothetical protein